MPQQFLYWPEQAYRVRRAALAHGDSAEVFRAYRGFALLGVVQGACQVDLGEKTLLADGGSILLLGPDVPCKLAACGGADAAVIRAEFAAGTLQPLAAALPGCGLAELLFKEAAQEPVRLLTGLPAAAQRELRGALEKLLALDTLPEPTPAAQAEGRLLLAALLLEFDTLYATHHRRGDDRQLAGLVRRYIAAHYAEKLDLTALAARFHTSPWHLCHAFKAGTGQSPIDYLNRTRVHAACDLLLREEELPVEEVARRCGCSGAAQLRRLFKQEMGCGPRQYRRRRQA